MKGCRFARLRTQGTTHLLTTKTPLGNAMECTEHETVVADRGQMHGALLALGYEPTVRIVKERRTGAAGLIQVCVDVVEGVGTFMELELERTGDTYDTLVRQG